MGKKLAKNLKGNFKYITGAYYGNYNNYDITIRYDYTSMLYNIYLCVKGKENIDKLNEILSKIDKYAVAKYKNNNLTITESCDNHKEVVKSANNILDELTNYLNKNKYKNICKSCQEEKKTKLVDIDSNIKYMCSDCINHTKKMYKEELNEKKKIKENVVSGIFGAIIGSIPGFVVWFILGYLMINPTIMGLIIMLGSAYFYKWFANSMKLPGLIISLIIGFIFIIFANELTCSYTLYNEYSHQYNINIIDAYKAMPYYLNNNEIFRASYNQNLVLSFIFAIFGSLTNLGIYFRYSVINKIKEVK